VNLDCEKLKLSRGSLIMARGSQYCSLYELQVKIERHEKNMADHNSSLALWHR